MAQEITDRDLSPILKAAQQWIDRCLLNDSSIFLDDLRWNSKIMTTPTSAGTIS